MFFEELTELTSTSTHVALTGDISTGLHIRGTDSVNIVP
jgi:hypothetical protein